MEKSYFAFIRHGQYHQPTGVPSALLPHGLTPEGKEQSIAGGEFICSFLKEHKIEISNVIHSSVLLRAWQTAEIIKTYLNESFPERTLQIESSELLCERSVGSVANMTVDEIEKVLLVDPRYTVPKTGWKSRPDYCLPFPGAESLLQAGQRVSGYIKSKLISGKLTLFVGHGASIRMAAYHLGIWDLEMASAHSMFHAHPVIYSYGTDEKYHLESGQWKVRPKKEEAND